jgi:hypothetical protein
MARIGIEVNTTGEIQVKLNESLGALQDAISIIENSYDVNVEDAFITSIVVQDNGEFTINFKASE